MIREILLWPDPILERPSEYVDVFGQELQRLAEDLVATCAAYGGAGLSAVQIGVSKRVFVIVDKVYVDPVVVGVGTRVSMDEGCLSFPGVVERVDRFPDALITYRDLMGNMHDEMLRGLPAQVAQHEYDHMDGIVLPARLAAFHRERFLKKYKLARRRVKSTVST